MKRENKGLLPLLDRGYSPWGSSPWASLAYKQRHLVNISIDTSSRFHWQTNTSIRWTHFLVPKDAHLQEVWLYRHHKYLCKLVFQVSYILFSCEYSSVVSISQVHDLITKPLEARKLICFGWVTQVSLNKCLIKIFWP